MEVIQETPENTTAPVESTESSAPVEASTPQVGGGDNQTGEGTPQVPTFTPDYKYKAGKVEKEIPEPYRPWIKDERTQKEVKELFEKADGIEFVKADRARVQEEYKALRQTAEPIFGAIQQINYFKQKGDIVSAVEMLGISRDQFLQAAIQEAQKESLPPEQKAVYDQQQEANRQAYELMLQNRQLEYQYNQMIKQQVTGEIYQAVSMPEIAPIVQAFNQRNGEGNFERLLQREGIEFFQQNGYDLPATDLAQRVIQKYGWNQVQTTPQVNQASPQPQSPRMPNQVPVIPNTGSGQVSPAARKPQSLDDLRKIAQEKFG